MQSWTILMIRTGIAAGTLVTAATHAYADDSNAFMTGVAGSVSYAPPAAAPESADDEEPPPRRQAERWFEMKTPEEHCNSAGTTWTLCGEDRVGNHSEFSGCILDFCFSCRLAAECNSFPEVWGWCDEGGSPCVRP